MSTYETGQNRCPDPPPERWRELFLEADAERAALRAEVAALREKYEELVFAVGNKHPGESRHETALRYIKRAEDCTAIDAARGAGEGRCTCLAMPGSDRNCKVHGEGA